MSFPFIVFEVLITEFAEHGHRRSNIVRRGCAIECHSLCCELNLYHHTLILSVITTLVFRHMLFGILNSFLSIWIHAKVWVIAFLSYARQLAISSALLPCLRHHPKRQSHGGYVEKFLIVGIPGGGNALLNRLLSARMIFSTRMSWATMLMQKWNISTASTNRRMICEVSMQVWFLKSQLRRQKMQQSLHEK